MGARERIFQKLSQTPSLTPGNVKGKSLPVVPNVSDHSKEMLSRFILEAEKLTCTIHQVANEKEAVETILALIEGEVKIMGWNIENIGLQGLGDTLALHGITIDASANPKVRYGLTGVDAALAATGSIILSSGPGKPRSSSLLPSIHIAVVRRNQVVKDLESWVTAIQKENKLHDASNVFVISGPSKTADIAMELVMGMHGPQELHLVLINS